MFTYFNKLDKKVNETLTLYAEIGKMSKPIFNYALVLISILIFTSCFSILYSLNNSDFSSENNFVHIALPIMIYGLVAPILSTIISYIFKEFIQQQIELLKNNKKLLINKSVSIIDKKIILNKENSILLGFFMIIYITDILNFCYNLCLNFIIFSFVTFYKFNNEIKNDVCCDIKSVEKCYDKNEEYYRYNIELNYGDQKKIIQKRFNDFKTLDNNLNNDKKLPTSSWMLAPNNLKDATRRGNKLNSYIQNIFENNKNLNNTIINDFIKNDDNKNTIRIIEKKNLNNKSDLNDLKHNITLLLGININNIKKIFILNEINCYLNNKKRIFIIIENYLYKIKYHKSNDSFEVRLKIDIFDIKKLIIGRITNTKYFLYKNVLEIEFNNTSIILTSFIENDDIYNITSIYSYLLHTIQHEIDIIHNYDYKLFTGFGISESIFNNPTLLSIKHFLKN